MTAEENVSVLLGDSRKAIRTMAVPLFLALIVVQANSIADRAWSSGLGMESLAAIGLCAPIYLVINGLGTGIGVGGAAAVARFIGSGDRDRAASAAVQTLILSVVVSAVLTPFLVFFCEDILEILGSEGFTDVAYDYMIVIMITAPLFIINGAIAGLLRGEGAAKMSTAMMVVTALLNIILDPILIYVLDMGIAGASTATVVATLVSTAFGSGFYLRGYVGSRIRGHGFSGSEMHDVMDVAVPQMAEYTVMYGMNLVLNWFVVFCAGAEGFAIYSVPVMVVDLALLPAYAIGSALVPVASSARGQGDVERMSEAFRYSLKLSLITILALMMMLIVLPEVFLLPFTYSDSTSYLQDDMVEATRIMSLCIPLYFVIPISASFLQALGMADRSLFHAIFRNLIFAGFYGVASLFSLEGIYWALVVGSLVTGSLIYYSAVMGFKRFRAGLMDAPAVAPR